MLDDFTPILHRLEGRDIRVWAIGDVHIGAREANLREFEKLLRRVEDDDDSYLIMLGDMLNNGIKDSLTNVYDEVMPPSEQIEYAADVLSPVADKILGCVGGNHELRSKKQVDMDPMLTTMAILRKQSLYRQNFFFMRVTLGLESTHDTYSIFAVHGRTANKKRQLSYAIEGVDCVVSGHTHDAAVDKPARLCFNHRNAVSVKHVISLTACSWLDYGGYAARGLYLPKATSDPQTLLLEYTGSNNAKGRMRVVW